jgi:hypothetical protein
MRSRVHSSCVTRSLVQCYFRRHYFLCIYISYRVATFGQVGYTYAVVAYANRRVDAGHYVIEVAIVGIAP